MVVDYPLMTKQPTSDGWSNRNKKVIIISTERSRSNPTARNNEFHNRKGRVRHRESTSPTRKATLPKRSSGAWITLSNTPTRSRRIVSNTETSRLQVSTPRLSIYVVQVITTNPLPISLFSFIDSVETLNEDGADEEERKWKGREGRNRISCAQPSQENQARVRELVTGTTRGEACHHPAALSIAVRTCRPTHLRRPHLEDGYSHSDDI